MQFLLDVRTKKERMTEFLATVNQIKMDEALMNFLMQVSSKSDVSPTGVLRLLSFIGDQIEAEQT